MSSSNNYNSSYNDDQAGSYNNTAGYNQQPYYDQQTYASHNGSGGGDESYNQNSQGYPSQQAGQYDFLDDPNYWSQTPAPFSYNDEAPPLTEEEIAEMQRQAETNDQSCDHTAADRVASAAYKERVDEYYRKVDEYGSQTGSRRVKRKKEDKDAKESRYLCSGHGSSSHGSSSKHHSSSKSSKPKH